MTALEKDELVLPSKDIEIFGNAWTDDDALCVWMKPTIKVFDKTAATTRIVLQAIVGISDTSGVIRALIVNLKMLFRKYQLGCASFSSDFGTMVRLEKQCLKIWNLWTWETTWKLRSTRFSLLWVLKPMPECRVFVFEQHPINRDYVPVFEVESGANPEVDSGWTGTYRKFCSCKDR